MWNHRVMRHKGKDGFPNYFQIHEVYYNEKSGKIWGWTTDGAIVGGDNIEEIKQVLQQMKKCLEQPILDFDMEPEEEHDSKPEIPRSDTDREKS